MKENMTGIQKFVRLDKKITSMKEVLNHLTPEEVEEVKNASRSVEMESHSKWAKVSDGEFERTLYPLYGLLTDTEKSIYRTTRKEKSGTGTSGNTRTSQRADEINKDVDFLVQKLKELGAQPEDIQVAEKFRVVKKVPVYEELFGCARMTEKCNLMYIMMRSPSGERAQEYQPNGAELFNQGFMPVMSLEQVRQKVKKLLESGIDVRNVIVDYKD